MAFLQTLFVSIALFFQSLAASILGPVDYSPAPSISPPGTNNVATFSVPISAATSAITQMPSPSQRPAFRWTLLSTMGTATPYSLRDSEIYFYDSVAVAEIAFPSANPSSFLVSVDQTGKPTPYSKDRDHVYFLRRISFTCASSNRLKLVILQATTSTFEPIYSQGPQGCDSYASDGNIIFHNWYPIVGADPSTFQIIYKASGTPSHYDKDKYHVFYDEQEIGEAEFSSMVLQNVDPSSFSYIDFCYVKDKDHVYSGSGKVISDADPMTFQALGGCYGKDRNHVFQTGWIGEPFPSYPIVEGADPSSFREVGAVLQCGQNCFYDAQDDQSRYLSGIKVTTDVQNSVY